MLSTIVFVEILREKGLEAFEASLCPIVKRALFVPAGFASDVVVPGVACRSRKLSSFMYQRMRPSALPAIGRAEALSDVFLGDSQAVEEDSRDESRPNIIFSGLGGVVTEQGIAVALSIH